jgi:hypothetical protein
MRNLGLLLIVCFLAGCGANQIGDPSSAANDLISENAKFRTKQEMILSELQTDNAVLSYLTRTSYTCGDPQDKRLQKNLSEIKTVLKTQNEAADKALKNIINYSAQLKDVSEGIKSSRAAAKEIADDASGLAKLLGIGPAALAISPLTQLLDSSIVATGDAAVARIAFSSRDLLKATVAKLKDEYVALNQANKIAFHQWESCDMEKLYVLRDMTNGYYVKYLEPQYAYPSTGVDLVNAYRDHVSMKRNLSGSPDFNKVLDALLAQNEALISQSSKKAVSDLLGIAQQIKDFKTT